MEDKITFEYLSSIDDIDGRTWDSLCGGDYPFLRHDFFTALEHSGSANTASGWQPHHLLIKNGQQHLVGLMPLFIKHHSYGEYVFDWSWADAYNRHGVDYYPKLLCAIPYTPATGPRLLTDGSIDGNELVAEVVKELQQECHRLSASSFHCLFPERGLHQQLVAAGASARTGCQFHWLNQDYTCFDDFLSTFNSRKRKNLNKERRRIAEQDLTIITKEGGEISEGEWLQFYQFYHLTYFKRSGRQGYLNEAFFLAIANTMADQIVMAQAYHGGQLAAASLFFKSGTTLYGRYWGCGREFDMLHFECCYYRGIEYAIQHGLQRFDPGAQGEHKIQRGFTPVPTYSNHWIARPDFRAAIEDFLVKEARANQHYIDDATSYLPFKHVDKNEESI